MNIGIVTTWFERGASYVSRQFMDVLSKTDNVYIYARGGEMYAREDKNWNLNNVWWGKRDESKLAFVDTTYIENKDFLAWLKCNNIDTIIFNEQRWWQPVLWCKNLGIKTIAYVDYYTEETILFFDAYDGLICNTHRHEFAFRNHPNAHYIKWGTNLNVYKSYPRPIQDKDKVVFFHSAGMAPERKGTDVLLKAYQMCENRERSKLIIHTQVSLDEKYPELSSTIRNLCDEGCLEILMQTISAPGLYHLGDVYVYPSRLDGIGLTLIEAISSGLACITVNNAPMNEFVDPSFGVLCDVDYQYCRRDGYYWPACEPSVVSLYNLMSMFIHGNINLEVMKTNARIFAEKEFNFDDNFNCLHNILEMINIRNVSDAIVKKINQYDKRDGRRYATMLSILYHLKHIF